MSRFADPAAYRTVDLGNCLCPGSPHPSDFAKIRSEGSYTDLRRFFTAQAGGDEGIAVEVAEWVTEWNLLGPNGEPWPPSAESLLALKVGTLTPLVEAIGEVIEASADIPKASGEPSPASSRGSTSRTQSTNRKRGT